MIADLTSQILDSFVEQLRKDENKTRLQEHLVDPVIRYILDKLWPFLIACGVIFSLITLLTLITIFLVIYDRAFRRAS